MPAPLLGRIARHPVSGLRDAREDRLTEGLAGVCDTQSCSGLAHHIARGWLTTAAEDRNFAQRRRYGELAAQLGDEPAALSVDVRTQFAVPGRRPDLELRFTSPRRPAHPIVIWVEVKHGTKPHSGQLQAYLDGQRDLGLRDAAVVLLAPRAAYPGFNQAHLPEEVARLRWQDTAATIAEYETADPVARFLVDELHRYLAWEGLVDPERLTPEHVLALEHRHDAMAALTRICEITAVVVASLWNEAEEPFRYPQREEPHEFWWPYRPYPRGGKPRRVTPWLWNFQLLPNSTYLLFDGQPGVPCVTAGVASGERRLATLDDSQIEHLVDEGFAVLRVKQGTRSSTWDYVIMTWYPRDLHGPGDLNAQATRLAEKINDAFRVIDEILDRR